MELSLDHRVRKVNPRESSVAFISAGYNPVFSVVREKNAINLNNFLNGTIYYMIVIAP